MLLRASSEMSGNKVDVGAVVDPSIAAESGIPDAALLIAFSDAVVGNDEAELERARASLLDAVGFEGLVDAAGVVGNFQRMVRIADGTGIPLDAPLLALTADLRRDLAINDYSSADNTPRLSPSAKLLGRVLAPAVGLAYRTMARVRGKT
jgi:hypothetical protein